MLWRSLSLVGDGGEAFSVSNCVQVDERRMHVALPAGTDCRTALFRGILHASKVPFFSNYQQLQAYKMT